jgi:predicted Rossmann fold flavoprotein
VLLAVGGYGQARQYDWIADGTGHRLVPPVPSLFTFNVPDSPLLDLAGVSVPEARVRVAQSDWAYDGPLLLTHWGISGPAVLKTSAWAARHLALAQYDFRVLIDWLPSQTHAQTEDWLRGQAQAHPNRQVANYPPEGLPRRLWERLCVLAAVPQATTWAQLPRKPRGRLLDFLRRMELHCRSKTTHKDEFVTAGGIDLSEVDPQTLRSRLHDNLWFAGELLDVDGLTGGFNFQAAWSTAWLAAQSLATV